MGFFCTDTVPTSQPSSVPWDFMCSEPKYFYLNQSDSCSELWLLFEDLKSSFLGYCPSQGLLGSRKLPQSKPGIFESSPRFSSFFFQHWLHAPLASSMGIHIARSLPKRRVSEVKTPAVPCLFWSQVNFLSKDPQLGKSTFSTTLGWVILPS